MLQGMGEGSQAAPASQLPPRWAPAVSKPLITPVRAWHRSVPHPGPDSLSLGLDSAENQVGSSRPSLILSLRASGTERGHCPREGGDGSLLKPWTSPPWPTAPIPAGTAASLLPVGKEPGLSAPELLWKRAPKASPAALIPLDLGFTRRHTECPWCTGYPGAVEHTGGKGGMGPPGEPPCHGHTGWTECGGCSGGAGDAQEVARVLGMLRGC